ncbi:PepSY-associated TM helix domain-containing protein [Pseudoalteromonas umbrosa]|uniref:PepSY-associated TM helix domain-containing protein n=1 Tax=Pseudoalteromonas umbrosa TaxID=3048489 RepID=UPI0024C24129|nr:PepSY-associated TM helix domain-containing protein [Pseudoalteromonas sp. B95]MDK1289361.1 PepSY-associated TM helix domain-containing protein [Pseudoalteromonas sp. B95]
MKNQTLKTLTNAHAWIGLIISFVLFIVFVAGSISLFRENIETWEKISLIGEHAPHSKKVSYDTVMAKLDAQYQVDTHHLFYLYEPTERNPFMQVYFAVELAEPHPETGEDHKDMYLLLDPVTGDIIADANEFQYANFVYHLHYDLGIGRIGLYFVGIITLFFFVALLSGVVIHWRKLFKNFYQYRFGKNKDKWLDAHNLIGTMGLPFHIMYAFTGLVFNLVIIYQISYALILYQGSQEKVLQAAGFNEPHIEEADKRMPMQGIDALYPRAMEELGDVKLRLMMIEHFGDENAVLVFMGKSNDEFSNEVDVRYTLKDQQQIYITTDNYDNNLRGGLATIASLHFGDFAGYGMRIAFFILGLATAYVIITGNLMWISKRAKQKKQSKRSLTFVTRLTSGAFIGCMAAIALGAVATKVIPLDLAGRMTSIQAIVYMSFFISIVASLSIKQQPMFCHYTLKLSGLLYALAALLNIPSYLQFSGVLSNMILVDLVIVDVMLISIGSLCWYGALKFAKKTEQVQQDIRQPDSELSTAP